MVEEEKLFKEKELEQLEKKIAEVKKQRIKCQSNQMLQGGEMEGGQVG